MKTTHLTRYTCALLCLIAGLFSRPMAAQNASGRDFVKWRLKTGGKVYYCFDDAQTFYFSAERPKSASIGVYGSAVLAVSAHTAKPKWVYSTQRSNITPIGRAGGLLYAHTGGTLFSSNLTVAIDTATGRGLWHLESADNQEQSSLQEGVFLVESGGLGRLGLATMRFSMFGRNSDRITQDDIRLKIAAVDFLKGEERWRIYLDTVGSGYTEDELREIEGSWLQIAVRGNLVFFSSSLYLAAAEVETGRVVWVNRDNKDRWEKEDVRPEMHGNQCFFGGPDILALHLLNGKTTWSCALDSNQRARLLMKNERLLFAELRTTIDRPGGDSSRYRLCAVDISTGKKIWQTDIDSSIFELNLNGGSIYAKIKNRVCRFDTYTGQVKSQIDLGDLQIWLSPDGTFLVSGGKDSIISLLRPDGSLIDTLHLGAAIERVFRPKNFPFLLLALQSGDVLALENKAPGRAPASAGRVVSAEALLANTLVQPLPPLRRLNTPDDNRGVIEPARSRLRDKRYGFSYEFAGSQVCKDGRCSEFTHRESFGLSYKKYIDRWWAAQGEIFYYRRGGKGLKVNKVDAFEYDLRYLDFHLLGELGTPANWPFRMYLFTGPYYAYPLRSRYVVSRQSGAVENSPFSANHDWGLIGGLGADYAVNRFFLYLEFRGYWGFRPLVSGALPASGATLAEGKNTAAAITLGIGF